MDNKKLDPFGKARDYAFLLLKFRLRSEKEIYQRLKKKFDEVVISQTLAFLKDKNFINDDSFTRGWIESRLRKPLGIRKIRQELKIKGISPEIIDKHLDSLRKSYSEENTVSKIVQEKFSKLKNIELRKAKRRIYAYLLRRGFSPQIVIDVLNQIASKGDSSSVTDCL